MNSIREAPRFNRALCDITRSACLPSMFYQVLLSYGRSASFGTEPRDPWTDEL